MVTLNLHNFVPRSRANGPGERAVVWVQGCPRACPGCFNPTSQPFETDEVVTIEELESRIMAIENLDGVTFSGGEPFCQAGVLAVLAERLNTHGLTTVCYTGFTLAELQAADRPEWNALLKETDLLIDGPYIVELRCAEPYRGSSNQQLHYLSGLISPDDVTLVPQAIEFTLDANGTVTATGFPQIALADEAFAEIAAILGGKEE